MEKARAPEPARYRYHRYEPAVHRRSDVAQSAGRQLHAGHQQWYGVSRRAAQPRRILRGRQQGDRRRTARAENSPKADVAEPEWVAEEELRALDCIADRSRPGVDRRFETVALARSR